MNLTKHGIIDFSAKRYIFKYQPINDYSKLNLRNKKLWASKPSVFNDPFELKYKQIGTNPQNDELHNLIEQSKHFKVACLTYDPLNILMWSHYANKHTGICLGFYDETLTYAVHYTDDFPIIDFDEKIPNKRIMQFHKMLNCKARMWEYEQERRICLVPGTPNELSYPGELFMVAFGINSQQKDIEEIKEIINDKNVIYYKCTMVDGHYLLDFDPA